MNAEELVEFGQRLERERNKFRVWLFLLFATWLMTIGSFAYNWSKLTEIHGRMENIRDHVHALTATVAGMKERAK